MGLLGSDPKLTGNVTRLNSVGAKPSQLLERDLGYGPGRLSQGYFIAILREKLRPEAIEFAGYSLRSGGRYGLPLADPAADADRERVHDRMVARDGKAHVDKQLAAFAALPENLIGEKRIVKVLPVIRHLGANPADEYPMGSGVPQWDLKKEHRFTVAVEFDKDGNARTAAQPTATLSPGRSLDVRMRLFRYLASC